MDTKRKREGGEERQNQRERERGKREGEGGLINNNTNIITVEQGDNNHANENAGKSVRDIKE